MLVSRPRSMTTHWHESSRAAYPTSEAAPPKSSHARVFEMTQRSQPCASGAEDHSDVLTSLTAPFEKSHGRVTGSLPVSASARDALRRQGPGPGRRAGSLGPPTAPLSMCSSVDSELNWKLKFEPRWPAGNAGGQCDLGRSARLLVPALELAASAQWSTGS
jgi:hypothetical protein